MDEHQFDYAGLLDEFRCHTTEWLRAERALVIREQRGLRVRELALTRVLDERGGVDDSQAERDGTRLRDLHRKRTTARNLERQPNLADAAAQGRLSDEQLDACSDLAGDDPDADERWAKEGPGWSPDDLADERRKHRKPTPEDGAARRKARELRFWWRHDHGMLDGRFSLPDIDGALFEQVFNHLIEQMRPAKGERWETRERRGADALVDVVRAFADRKTDEATSAPPVRLVVLVPRDGPATVAGIPLPDAMVEALRARARVEPVLVDDDGEPIAVGRIESILSEKTKRVVRQRDGKCRWPGCEHRLGLQVHHLWPASWGGSDQISNLASVCAPHHAQLAPQGALLLLGNPNNPAGLSLIDRDDLPALAGLAAHHDPKQARAGPEAA